MMLSNTGSSDKIGMMFSKPGRFEGDESRGSGGSEIQKLQSLAGLRG